VCGALRGYAYTKLFESGAGLHCIVRLFSDAWSSLAAVVET